MIDTKTASFYATIDAGTMPPQRQAIYDYIQTHPEVSRNDLDLALPYRLSAICGRVNELIASEFIEVAGKKWDDITQRNVETLRVTVRAPEQLRLIAP